MIEHPDLSRVRITPNPKRSSYRSHKKSIAQRNKYENDDYDQYSESVRDRSRDLMNDVKDMSGVIKR